MRRNKLINILVFLLFFGISVSLISESVVAYNPDQEPLYDCQANKDGCYPCPTSTWKNCGERYAKFKGCVCERCGYGNYGNCCYDVTYSADGHSVHMACPRAKGHQDNEWQWFCCLKGDCFPGQECCDNYKWAGSDKACNNNQGRCNGAGACIQYDNDANICSLGGFSWVEAATGPNSKCCGVDLGEYYCGQGFTGCEDSVYIADDGDYSNYICSDCGNGYWNIGGEVDSAKCCGDDSAEYRTSRVIGIDSTFSTDSNDDACCMANNKCVENSECTISGATKGNISNKTYCNEGTWIGGDASEVACDNIVGDNYWNLGGEMQTANNFCCGDDNNEFKKARICVSGVCSANATDDACCGNQNDCVYNEKCYPVNTTKLDLTQDGDNEICSNAGWTDGDLSQENCNTLNGHPRVTRWMTNANCGKGDCNEAGADNNFCCGDDVNETIKEGFGNVCFKEEDDCYYDGNYRPAGWSDGDEYCEKGTITSRTKLIAIQLLDIANNLAENNYTLFCDTYENVLNYYDYRLFGDSDMVKRYLDGGLGGFYPACKRTIGGSTEAINCINNICVLKSSNQVLFGTSLNKPINQEPYPFLKALGFGVSYCNSVLGENDGKFHSCAGVGSNAWYNPRMQAVIYSKNSISYDAFGTFNFWEKFLLFLKNPFKAIFDYLIKLLKPGGITQQRYDYDFINSTKKFSTLYLDRKKAKSIKGILEEVSEQRAKYLSIAYSCYTDDICKTINVIDERIRGRFLPYPDRIICHYNSTTGKYYVVSNSTYGLELWQELTAKLRTIDTGNYPDTKPTINLRYSPKNPKVSETITFTAELDSCNAPHQYLIEFGDGSQYRDTAYYTIPPISKAYSKEGRYNFSLALLDSNNDVTSSSISVDVSPVISVDAGPVELPCEVRPRDMGCNNNEFCILSLSDQNNAHASGCNSNFNYLLCCPNTYELDNSCSQAGVVRLSSLQDAHASFYGMQSQFEYGVCVKSTDAGKMANCRATYSGCEAGELCVVSLSGLEDAHVGVCGAYPTDICCRISENAVENCMAEGDEDSDGDINCADSDCAEGTRCDAFSSNVCHDHICTCVPDCNGKECGSDGCGGLCGPETAACTATFGTCTATGAKTCTGATYGSCTAADPRIVNCQNKECGSDGCGGSCGTCSTGTCQNGACVGEGTVIYIEPATQQVSNGANFFVGVKINNVNDIWSAPFHLTYDASKLRVVNAQDGGFLQGTFLPETVPDTDGDFVIGNARMGQSTGVSGSGTLVIITLKALSSGASQLGITDVNFVDSQNNPITLNVQGGSATIS